MFFVAFDKNIKSPLNPETTYAVEYIVSQLLVGARPKFLRTVISNGQLAEALLQELEFLGRVPQVELPLVQQYLAAQVASQVFCRVAADLARRPTDEGLRERLATPDASLSMA
jgi:hypothetical protein